MHRSALHRGGHRGKGEPVASPSAADPQRKRGDPHERRPGAARALVASASRNRAPPARAWVAPAGQGRAPAARALVAPPGRNRAPAGRARAAPFDRNCARAARCRSDALLLVRETVGRASFRRACALLACRTEGAVRDYWGAWARVTPRRRSGAALGQPEKRTRQSERGSGTYGAARSLREQKFRGRPSTRCCSASAKD